MSEHPTQEQLAEFVYGERTPQQQAEMERHLDGCPDCRAVAESWRGARVAMQRWQIPPRTDRALSAARASRSSQVLRWAVAAMIMVGLGYGIGWISAIRNANSPQLRAELAGELRGELRDQLHAEFAKFVSDQSAQQQQAYQRALVQAANQLDARRVADYASLRRDVETVALQTQEKFDSMSVPAQFDQQSPANSGNP